jgi:hypothetical protein
VIGRGDEPQSWGIGLVIFPVIFKVNTTTIFKTLLDLSARNLMFVFKFF